MRACFSGHSLSQISGTEPALPQSSLRMLHVLVQDKPLDETLCDDASEPPSHCGPADGPSVPELSSKKGWVCFTSAAPAPLLFGLAGLKPSYF